MATYLLSLKHIGRKDGQAACAAAAYRAGCEIEDERYGKIHNYTRRGGVFHTEIMSPANAPEWMQDRSQLWNAVEAAEKRKDSRLSTEILLSLPHEMTDDERLALVRDFVGDAFVQQGMVADVAIHRPHKEGDDRNHHAHVLLTTRVLTHEGFGKKDREWTQFGQSDKLTEYRKEWASYQNRALEHGGYEARVDHRSLADQGIDREPEPKLGPVATKMEREGRPSHAGDDLRAVWQRNAERAAREEQHNVLSLEIERERLRLLEGYHHAAKGQQDDGYARAKPTPTPKPSEPDKRDRKAEAQEAERARQQAALEALRNKVQALEASLEGRNGLAVFLDKLRGRVGWKAGDELAEGRVQLAELERGRAVEEARQRREDRREDQARNAPQRDVGEYRRAQDRKDDPPERLTIKAVDAFRRGDPQDAPPGDVVDFEAAKEAVLQARLERRREIIEQMQERDERDGPERER